MTNDVDAVFGSFSVTIASFASLVDDERGIDELAVHATGERGLRRPAPMLAATSSTVTGWSKVRWLPSGSVTTGMRATQVTKSRRRFFK